MPTPGDRVRQALGSRRAQSDDTIYARAKPAKTEITEEYSLKADISKNRAIEFDGAPTGQITIEIPYDGREYFTRQAADDVERGLGTHPGNGERKAIVGHLLLGDHSKTDLRNVMQLHNQVGVIPLAVPVTAADGGPAQLIADRRTCVIEYDYQPDYPSIYPVELDVELYDRDNLTLDMFDIEALTRLGNNRPSELIENLRQEASFTSELLLRIDVRISLPVKKSHPPLTPMIERMSVGWPTVTSLRTTELFAPNRGAKPDDPELRKLRVRYNPVQRCLEWEKISVPQLSDGKDEGDSGVRVYSEVMLLNIGHPGELFQQEKLSVQADVEIPGYLMSGVEARMFDARGDVQYMWLKLATRLHVSAELYPADVFEERTFSPYQQYFFSDIIPDEMRITDIVTVLRNSKFDVYKRWPDLEDQARPKWLLMAKRRQGPDDFDLLVAVEGKRNIIDREQIMADSKVRHSGKQESGQLKISVLGMLPRDHRELTREMNALQRALRDRFRFQQTSGR
jgi:hypothetical protein